MALPSTAESGVRVLMNHGATEQGVEADEARQNSGASQLNSSVRRTPRRATKPSMAKALRLLVAALLLAASAVGCTGLFCIACDGLLAVKGQVLALNKGQASTRSAVILDVTPDSTRTSGSVPLQGCSVVLEPWPPSKRPAREGSSHRSWRAVTDDDGRFDIGGTAKPGNYPATLSIACPGYQPLEQEFTHDRLRHQATVLMAPWQPR